MFELKPLSAEAVPAALAKAEHYRLLNEPVQAESICRDILRVDADNRKALVTLILALTDQLTRRLASAFRECQQFITQLDDSYSRAYYSGLLSERRASAHHAISAGGAGWLAYDWYRRAMEHYENAIEQRPPGNDDAVLRWNACARTIDRHNDLEPSPEETFQPLLE